MKRVERIRLYPTTRQATRLQFALDITRELFNALLEERRDAWRRRRISISAKQQYAEITALRSHGQRLDGRMSAVYRECEDAVLHRLDLAMRASFRRIRLGEKPGFPRFKPRSRWHQLEFPHGSRALIFDSMQKRVKIPKIGLVRLRKGRRIPECFGRAWVVERNDRWYLCVEHEIRVKPKRATTHIVGIDRGVHVLAATSNGDLIKNLAVGEKRKVAVGRLQREVDSRTKKDAAGRCINRKDPSRIASVKRFARAKEHEANARRDYAHKKSRHIVDNFDCIGLESLNLRRMTRSARGTAARPGRSIRAKSSLNRVLLDAGFGLLRQMIESKAEEAGVTIVTVDARFSSQTCSRCGNCERGNRRRRRFRCLRCGFATHADINAALEIRRRAELKLLSSEPHPAEEAGRSAFARGVGSHNEAR